MSEQDTKRPVADGNDDERHRREEAERRAKRKASKSARPETEKDRQRKEYRQEILRKHGAAAAGGNDTSASSSKRQKVTAATVTPVTTSSAFQELFAQRARGFQIDFRFRNAPPRPPVGPCFVGNSLDSVLLEQSRQYKPHNAVEGNHTWKLHVEADIGVPLAPSAMDERSYVRAAVDETNHPKLHPDDEALLNWTGSMGDTAAEQFKRYQEQTRAAARLSISQQPITTSTTKTGPSLQDKKKVFSRVLKEDMQTWMKKTTYLSNDYSRKVHDFKSLAQVKSDLASELHNKQIEMSQQRSVKAISESFERKKIEHPTNKELKVVREYQVLPDVTNWGRAFTHVVIDKIPTTLPTAHTVDDFNHSFIINVEKHTSNNTRTMVCNVIVPSKDNNNDRSNYRPVQSYDLDVLPLKEADTPHMNFTLWLDKSTNVAYYIPIASRVQLSMGRPSANAFVQPMGHRKLTDKELSDMEERIAEVDQDMAEKHHISNETTGTALTLKLSSTTARKSTVHGTASANDAGKGDNDDGEGDFGDDDDEAEDDAVFGGGRRTIVAES